MNETKKLTIMFYILVVFFLLFELMFISPYRLTISKGTSMCGNVGDIKEEFTIIKEIRDITCLKENESYVYRHYNSSGNLFIIHHRYEEDLGLNYKRFHRDYDNADEIVNTNAITHEVVYSFAYKFCKEEDLYRDH